MAPQFCREWLDHYRGLSLVTSVIVLQLSFILAQVIFWSYLVAQAPLRLIFGAAALDLRLHAVSFILLVIGIAAYWLLSWEDLEAVLWPYAALSGALPQFPGRWLILPEIIPADFVHEYGRTRAAWHATVGAWIPPISWLVSLAILWVDAVFFWLLVLVDLCAVLLVVFVPLALCAALAWLLFALADGLKALLPIEGESRLPIMALALWAVGESALYVIGVLQYLGFLSR